MKKRGMWSVRFTAELIIALISFGLIALMFKNLAHGADIGYNKQICRMSVITNAKARLVGKEFYNINCPTRYVTIEPKKYIIESKGTKDEFDINCGKLGNDESQKCFFNKVNRLIAGLIFDCWDQFAAGQLPVFSQYYEDKQCLICARIEFKDMPHNLDGFYSGDSEEYSLTKYMRTHNPLGKDKTYYELSLDIVDIHFEEAIEGVYEYDLVQPMAVVFNSFNGNYVVRALGWSWDKVKDLASFVWRELPFTGETEGGEEEEEKEYFVNALDFIEYSKVAKECDALR